MIWTLVVCIQLQIISICMSSIPTIYLRRLFIALIFRVHKSCHFFLLILKLRWNMFGLNIFFYCFWRWKINYRRPMDAQAPILAWESIATFLTAAKYNLNIVLVTMMRYSVPKTIYDNDKSCMHMIHWSGIWSGGIMVQWLDSLVSNCYCSMDCWYSYVFHIQVFN